MMRRHLQIIIDMFVATNRYKLLMTAKLKSVLNATWKVGLGLFGIAALLVGILIFGVWYENTHGRSYRYDKNLSKDITVHCYNGARARVWNRRTERYVTPKLRWVADRPLRDSVTVYADVDGNRGYLNCNNGEIVIPAGKARYRHAWQFSEGLAFVVLPYPEEECLTIIDYAGNIIAKNVASYEGWYDYVFVDGVCKIRVDGKYGLLAKDGSWAVEPKYSDIESPNALGYRLARNGDSYWLYDPDLKLVFSEPYDKMGYAVGRDEGTGSLYRTKNHVKQLVEYDGSVIEPFVIDGTCDLKYVTGCKEDSVDVYALDPDLVVYRVDKWEGLMNRRTGRVITPAVYAGFQMVSRELISAGLSLSDDESVVLDRNGRVVKQ